MNILHRDISPSNILVMDERGVDVVVCDFGLGRDTTELARATNSSSEGYGHMNYVAPEQYDELKSATEKSDIYSLGKVLNFLLTGKVPKIFHPCDFGVVIKKATSEDPGNRHADICEFDDVYEATKKLLFRSVELPKDSPKDFGVGESINWHEFHKVVALGTYQGHVWSEWLDPVLSLLQHGDNLSKYVRAIGPDIDSFLSQLVDNIRACSSEVGWPFSDTSRFGSVLRDLFFNLTSPNDKLLCLQAIWDLAFPSDQWNVQPKALEVMRKIPPSIATDFAQHILEVGVGEKDWDYFRDLQLDKSIQNAIKQQQQ